MSTPLPRRIRGVLATATVCALSLGFVAATPASAAPALGVPPLVITEIVADNPGDDNFEYFEVHNTTTDALPLANAGITFAYSYVDSSDRARDVPLAVDGDVSIAAGETVLFWLSYTSGKIDSTKFTIDGFRDAVGADAATNVVRVTGQAGMANGGDRGIRILDTNGIVSWSHYPVGSMGQGQATHFRLPADSADLGMDVLAPNAALSPGVVDPAAFVRPTPEPDPVPAPGPAANWPLIVTEIAPDHVGFDNFEFFEVHNTTNLPIDLAAEGYSFAYGPVASDDLTGDKALTAETNLVIGAGETVLYWLSYTDGNVDSFAKTEADFRTQWAVPAGTQVARITGQNGMANTSARGIRVVQTTPAGVENVSWSHYPVESVSTTTTAQFRIPGDIAENGLSLLETAAATPGVVKDEALTAPEPEPTPGWSPKPDPSLTTARLQVTELLPDSTNVGAADGFEFIELYNATSEPIDFSDYTINYLYPIDATSNSNEVLWPAQPDDVVIKPGTTLVFWIKNSSNAQLGADAFNAQFGADLELGTDLVEITSAGMANSGARGIEVRTNTGFSVSRAYFNMGATDDTVADQGIRYAVTPEDLGLQRMLGLAAATPGTIQEDQVPAGLMIDPVDTTAPVITDRTATTIDPAANFTIELDVNDNVQVRTVKLELSNNVDDGIRSINLVSGADGMYRSVVNAADLIGKKWYEYTVTARDGSNITTTETRRVAVDGVNTDPIRLNVTDGQYVGGDPTVIAAGDDYPSDLELSIDGTPIEGSPSLESAPTFVFEAGSVNTFFQNGVRIGDDVLTIFDDGIPSGFETVVTPVPLDYVVEGDELVVSIWAGTKAAPEIDLNENNDDFQVKGMRLVLPDGRTLTPARYDSPATVLEMGDSAGKLDFYDARFTLPTDAFTGESIVWNTADATDGEHVVSATNGAATLSRTVIVDNTAPAVTSSIVDGTAYQGEIRIEAEISDAGAGVGSYTATLDGMPITLPYTTSSLTLNAGTHAVVIESTDKVGNLTRFEASFTTFVEQPTGGVISPAEGDQVEAGDVSLSAKVDDPTGDVLDVSFREGYRLDLKDGDVSAQSGTTQDAAATDREKPVALKASDVAALETVDGIATEVSSDTEFPYQLFDVAVPADAGADASVRVNWSGTANANAQVILYALTADGGSWTEVTRHLTATDDEAFTLTGTVDVASHAVDGSVSILVQHSEGFAGADQTDRDDAVAPHNAADVPRSDYDFTLAWESDTQYYNAEYYDHQVAIHDYLLDRREELNLQYVFHTGDIVDDSLQPYQWANADPQYQRFDDAGLPYGVLAGNHDVGHKEVDYTQYGQYFGEDRYVDNPWYGGSYQNNRGHYDLMTAGGIDFLMLYMGWGPADAEIDWMNEVLAAYPERIAIVNQHEFMLTTGGLGAMPQRIMDEVVATNPNVKMVFSGHYHDAFTRVDEFDDNGDGTPDRKVHSMLFDYQGLPEGGQGFLRLLHFDNESGQMMVRTYSPSLDQYNSDEASLLGPVEDPYMYQDFEVSYADLGITPATKTLATDAFSAEILTAHDIASFADVPSGSVLTATWPLEEFGEHGWYVRTADPFGAVDYSAVSLFRVIAAAEEPEPTTPPGSGGGGTPIPDPAGDGGATPIGSGATPGKGSGTANTADGLAHSGSPIDGGGAAALSGLALLLAGLGLHLLRRGKRQRV
ncbi:hypothetical protein L1277_001211 [Okibacterium sp. HSC-33S16]|uniref:lamin tail domain-containing protein n=1 Tax=Okibacterium sp. HSC-33S16 TaxID=2910965 RepID=UPI0020A0DAAC|nr:lamin tail domain-containing protein [Okibacterium sp. HSC-33S16]MCP2031120.1 hypothetical protein [Okibacterium sp. HSC-33S16]